MPTPVDMNLIMQVEMLTTGADVHKINGLVQMYQSSAKGTSPQSRAACVHFEQALKDYLAALHRSGFRCVNRS